MSTVALVPAKSLAEAKSRLALEMTQGERAQLSSEMLQSVLRAILQLPDLDSCGVVSADEAVLDRAKRLGATPLQEETSGLNRALDAGLRWAVDRGATRLLVALSDLPLARTDDFEEALRLAAAAPVVLAPSKDGGTNVLVLRPPGAIPFRFGGDSARHHRFEAARRGLAVAVVARDALAFDVDTPEDLQAYRAVEAGRLRLDEILLPARR